MIKSANRIANVEEYYFSRKLAEVRNLDTPDLRYGDHLASRLSAFAASGRGAFL